MTIDAWLQAAIADIERRGLPELKPLLETLARATTMLRAADFNHHATGSVQSPVTSHQSSATSHQSAVGSDQSSGGDRQSSVGGPQPGSGRTS
jgi:hypothetical protein